MNAENGLEQAKKCVQEGDECRKLFGAEEKLFSKGRMNAENNLEQKKKCFHQGNEH
jgi:hypothetical protein